MYLCANSFIRGGFRFKIPIRPKSKTLIPEPASHEMVRHSEALEMIEEGWLVEEKMESFANKVYDF